MKRPIFILLLLISFILAGISQYYFDNTLGLALLSAAELKTPSAIITSNFVYTFNVPGKLVESGQMDYSSSPYWWLNSGAYLHIVDGVGKTIDGNLSIIDKWRLIYSSSNPVDTDNGYHPQNIFRLLTRSKWGNFKQEAYFKINKDNLSKSPNRDASNGLLLFNRYQDGNNLYYVGTRVDGAAVIKKKQNGTYHTIAYKKIFPGIYNRDTNPNLLPKNVWIGLRSESQNNADGSVAIKLFMDKGKTGTWTLVLEAKDTGSKYGVSPIVKEGYAGIRTDFMDVSFDDYKAIPF
ncbi:MAG: hypothetical protein AAB367_00165 [Patescibacteria group bacterium]